MLIWINIYLTPINSEFESYFSGKFEQINEFGLNLPP